MHGEHCSLLQIKIGISLKYKILITILNHYLPFPAMISLLVHILLNTTFRPTLCWQSTFVPNLICTYTLHITLYNKLQILYPLFSLIYITKLFNSIQRIRQETPKIPWTNGWETLICIVNLYQQMLKVLPIWCDILSNKCNKLRSSILKRVELWSLSR